MTQEKERCLVLRIANINKDIDSYDCYHDIDINVAIPSNLIVELTKDEQSYLNKWHKHKESDAWIEDPFIFVPIIDAPQVDALLKQAKEAEEEDERKTAIRNKKAVATKIRNKKLAAERKHIKDNKLLLLKQDEINKLKAELEGLK